MMRADWSRLLAWPGQLVLRIVLAAIIGIALPATSSAQITVLISGGFRGAYDALLPGFEKASGVKVSTLTGASIGGGPTTIPNQIRSGVNADIVIMAREGLDDLIREKLILTGSDVSLAQALIGMIVRRGAPKPDISTVDAFKRTLVAVKSIGYSDSASGTYLSTTLFQKLGIADQVLGKSRKVRGPPSGEPVAAVSVGMGGAAILLDLDYEEDAGAMVDMNFVATESGRLVEVQGTAEGAPFGRGDLDAMLDAALGGVATLVRAQRDALGV